MLLGSLVALSHGSRVLCDALATHPSACGAEYGHAMRWAMPVERHLATLAGCCACFGPGPRLGSGGRIGAGLVFGVLSFGHGVCFRLKNEGNAAKALARGCYGRANASARVRMGTGNGLAVNGWGLDEA